MHTISDTPLPYGIHVVDGKQIHGGSDTRFKLDERYKRLGMLVDLLRVNTTSEYIVTDGVNSTKDIHSYNKNNTNQFLDHKTIRTKKIDITLSDLLLGDIEVILNLTNEPIRIVREDGYVKWFLPIEQESLSEYSGNVYFITIHHFNLPHVIRDLTGAGNYLQILYDKTKNNKKRSYMASCYKFAVEHLSDLIESQNTTLSNTVKIATILSVSSRQLHEPVYVEHFKAKVEYCNGEIDNSHPLSNLDSLTPKDIKLLQDNKSYCCYINDLHDTIGERYISFGGCVSSVHKTKNRDQAEGLYFIYNGDKDTKKQSFTPLEEIDQSKFVYTSREEALIGADVGKQYADNLERTKQELALTKERVKQQAEQNKHEMELVQQTLKQENERVKNEMELARESLKQDYERTKHDLDLAKEALKHKNEIERSSIDHRSMRDKYDYEFRSMGNKYTYETERYKRDTTLETLKTVAAVAGVIATGILLFKKFN